MKTISDNLQEIKSDIPDNITLVAVSKTRSDEEIMQIYQAGHRVFGENKVQELIAKQKSLPKDIEWHMIGHLQSNKVKYIAGFIDLIHSVDSFNLLKIINKEAKKNNRLINCLLQIHIASEHTKFGFSIKDVEEILSSDEFALLQNVKITGLMGMATFTTDNEIIRKEFRYLRSCFKLLKESYFSDDSEFKELSMGMTNDYNIAIEEGSTIVRIGTLIFGERNYK